MADDNLNDVVEEVVSDAEVMTVNIDDTLTVSGEAADAKAVGDALALKADKSELSAAISVNGQSADNQGHIIVDASQIEMSSSDTTKVKAAIEAAAARTGADIPVSAAVGAKKIGTAISELDAKNATQIKMAGTGDTTISQKIAAMDVTADANSTAITNLNAKAGDTIKLEAGGTETIKQAIEKRVKTVNGDLPDETGNVNVTSALFADNLTSSQSQNTVGEFVRRTAGGNASIQDGSAWLSSIRGNRTHIGYVAEQLNMTVTAAPREQGQDPITATIDRDTFVAYVDESSTINLVYTTSWSADPTDYGVTVTGDPVSGDQITIVYVKEDRGTIIQSDPQTMVSTGWNLYDHENTYAIGLKYSDEYGFYIGGTYTAVKYSSTLSGTKSTITPVDGYFDIPANGYIWVEGGNSTDTVVYMTWSDWVIDGPDTFEAYDEDVIDLSDVMEENFPYGLLRVGDVRDEIDFNTGLAISNVQRLAYSAENLATAVASGRTYECDTNYIYLERASAVTAEIEVEGQYDVSDHGLEYFTGTSVAVYAVILYGNNLKNKLERDVLTKSQDLVDNLTTNDGTKALSAKQGKALNDQIANQTHITINSSSSKYIFSQYIYAKCEYIIKANVCYVNLTFTCVTPSTSTEQIATGLPVCAINDQTFHAPNARCWDDATAADVSVLIQNGILYFRYGTANKVYATSFCYPVKI